MNDFKKPSGFGGNNRDRGTRPPFRGHGHRDGQTQHMYPATCDRCHKQCEVPFQPTGSKPVYCKDCFSIMRESSDHESPRRDSQSHGYPKRDFSPSPSPARPPMDNKKIDDLKRQIDSLNAKVDRLIAMAEKNAPAKTFPIFEKPKEIKSASPAAKPSLPAKAAAKLKKEAKKDSPVAAKKPAKKKK